MTIDEAIAIMKSAFKECIEHDTELNVVDANVDILNALEELKWWRSQDLIRRSDVHNMIKDYCRIDAKDCKEKVGCDYCKFLSVQQIPKAEYTGEQKWNTQN